MPPNDTLLALTYQRERHRSINKTKTLYSKCMTKSNNPSRKVHFELPNPVISFVILKIPLEL